MRRLGWSGTVVILLFALLGTASAESRTEWRAQWISHPTAPLKDPLTLHFRKTLTLDRVPAHFVVHVSADNRFVFYVNGVRAGDGPARGDLAHWRYETLDLARLLRPGTNTLAATVWNFGVYAPVAQMTERTAFMVEGDSGDEASANTNASWMVEEEPGQTPLPRPASGLHAYFASGPGEVLRADRYDWGWRNAGAGGPGWVAAAPALREALSPGAGVAAARGVTADVPWQLVADQLPPMAYIREDPGHLVRTGLGEPGRFPESSVSIPARTHVELLLDRGELTTAYPRLAFSGGAGAKISLVYAEALYDSRMHKGNRNEVGTRKAVGITDEIYPDGGAGRVFETLWWRTWRYLDLEVETGESPLTLESLEAYFTAYPFEVRARFHSADSELDRIWQIGWHTAQLDAHETYMDTPYYEQLQYAGDTRIQAMITYAVTGTDLLPRQAIRALDDSRIPAGITASRYPSQLPQYIPPFSLLWIGMIHDYYMYRDDPGFVRSMLPGARTVLEWFAGHQHEDGVLGRLPWWSFIDWVGTQTAHPFPSYDRSGESCLTTMQYIGALEDAVDLEKTLGAQEYAALDAARLERARHGVVQQCWDAGRGLFADNADREMWSQHTNMLAVLYDVAPREDQAGLMRRVLLGHDGPTPLIGASYYFRYYLARALDHAGMADEYPGTLGDWRGFLKMGFTTWPEEPGETRSDSHAWSAHPTFDLLTLVAGIAPASPGFRTVRIAPHPGPGAILPLEAAFPHPKGLIRVRYADGQAHIELPPGLTGEFVWKGRTTALSSGATAVPMN